MPRDADLGEGLARQISELAGKVGFELFALNALVRGGRGSSVEMLFCARAPGWIADPKHWRRDGDKLYYRGDPEPWPTTAPQ